VCYLCASPLKQKHKTEKVLYFLSTKMTNTTKITKNTKLTKTASPKKNTKSKKVYFIPHVRNFINIKRKKTIIATGSEKQTKNLNDQKQLKMTKHY